MYPDSFSFRAQLSGLFIFLLIPTMRRASTTLCCLALLLAGCSHLDSQTESPFEKPLAITSSSAIALSNPTPPVRLDGFFYSSSKRSSALINDLKQCSSSIRTQNELNQIKRCMSAQGYLYYELPNSSYSESKIRLDIRRAIASYNQSLNELNEQMVKALEQRTCLRGELTTQNMHRIHGDISAKELSQIIFFLEKDIRLQEKMMQTVGPWLKDSDRIKRLIEGRRSMIESLKQSKRPISWAAYNLYNHRHISYDRFISFIKSQELRF